MKVYKLYEMSVGRKKRTNFSVEIDGKVFSNKITATTFRQVINYIVKKVGVEKFKENINLILSSNNVISGSIDSFSSYISKASIGLIEDTDLFLSSHSSTAEKKNIIESISDYFELDTKVEFIEDSSDDTEDDSDDFEPELELIKPNIKMTFIEAAQEILKQNNNRPMTSEEIYSEIESQGLVQTSGLTPQKTLNAAMILYSDNSTAINKNKNSLFKIIEGRPYKFILLNPDAEIQPVSDLEATGSQNISDTQGVFTHGKLPQKFDIESELNKAQREAEEDVLSFKKFRATEPNERPDALLVFNDYVKNPFSQAICVLGISGAGKSTTIDSILQKSGHVYQFIIPSASTTGLLSQFSPSAGASGGYISSRLGKMIELAYKNKNLNYTAVFDECHKTSIIEMINDELLQAISENRNKGLRFISLDDDTRTLYTLAKEDGRGNVLVPNNFGFIFISSNARVISGNPDFFNRVDLIELSKEDRKLQSIQDLNQKRVTSVEDKKELVNKIVSGGE